MEQAGSVLLHIGGATKRYGARLVLDVKELQLFAQERVMICGPNGSGKSTLLRMILGVTAPTQGLLTRSPEMRQARVGYLPQSGGLYPELSLRDNLRLRAEVQCIDAGKPGAWQPVEALGLMPSLHKRFGELSGGYQRLASLAAALMNAPHCLILDEPFAGMDSIHRELVIQTLQEYAAQALLLIVALPEKEDLPFINRQLCVQEGKLI